MRRNRLSREVRLRGCHSLRALRSSLRASRAEGGSQGVCDEECGGHELVSAVRTVRDGGTYLSHPIEEELIDDYLLQCVTPGRRTPVQAKLPRERDPFASRGRENKQRDRLCLGISRKTVSTYLCRAMEKLSISDISELVRFGIQNSPALVPS
jgi:DNA-binding NarL/FixJ family response regulator